MSDPGDMSALVALTTVGAVIAVAAERQREEEVMTPYTAQDLAEDWEFKILRARGPKFADPAVLRAVLAEEARAQWVLVEKFDESRLRLKRRAAARAADGGLGFDPYRTVLGAEAARRTTLIVLSCVLLTLASLIALAVFLVVTQSR